MKTYRYIFLTLAAATIASACSEELNPNDINKANPGDEVQFGAALPGKTKTVYGEETSTGFPIYWVNGDKVRVASPQCMSGRNAAEYSVAVEKETQNYASSLTKTGDAGVQWGDAETADFYSIYPATASTKLEVSGESVSTTLRVDATQFASTKDLGTSYYAQPAEMGNVIMYAKTMGVNRNDPKTKGVVELHYTPFSTVLEFEINAPTQQVANRQTTITIQSITVTAPTTIAGDFAFSFPTADNAAPAIEAAAGGRNTITMHFLADNMYTTVLSLTKPTLKAKMCLMPISGVESLDGWKVEVNTSAGTFAKTLTSSTGALEPGLVHKIKLPKLNYASDEWNYDPANWIPSLPDYRNIYLSEISLPGAWYAGSKETYQATSDIATLWNAGVRAFAVECRSWSSYATASPSRICVSGSGRNGTTGDGYVDPLLGSAKMISEIISSIAGAIKNNEYGVLVLSYADGGEGGHRDSDHSFFLAGIANEITQSGVSNIYTGPITAETTVKDVLGKLIIKVNVDSNIPVGSYTGMNALVSYNPFLSQMSGADFARPYYSNLYWSGWSDDNKSYDLVANLQTSSDNANKFVWVFSSANRTQVDKGTDTTIPKYEQRQSALGAMMDYSKQIYDASTHNVWFYFNCGGTQADSQTSKNPSPTDFAKAMNPWLLDQLQIKIGDKVNTSGVYAPDPSPLGIVMFNQCTGANATYYGADIIKAIIEMNSKFYLKHAGTSGGSTGGTVENTAPNDATVQDGGNAI